jgi:hypothetical protein
LQNGDDNGNEEPNQVAETTTATATATNTTRPTTSINADVVSIESETTSNDGRINSVNNNMQILPIHARPRSIPQVNRSYENDEVSPSMIMTNMQSSLATQNDIHFV